MITVERGGKRKRNNGPRNVMKYVHKYVDPTIRDNV